MYIAQLTNLDDPDFDFYDLLGEVPATETIPPVMLPEAYQDRLALDEEFMAEFYAAHGVEAEATETAQ
jgi:hypothetical protein